MKPKSGSNELKLLRIYDAPVELVWEAWTDPVKTAQWWGPRGFSITTHSKDLRPGGHWKYTMHGPDGTDYPNKTLYYEVEECKKLVYDHGGSDDRPPLFRVTVLFSEEGGKTKLDMTMALASHEAAVEIGKFIKKAGGTGTWDRLAEYLEKGKSGKEQFVINRSFDAPVDLMYELWTQAEDLGKWLAPAGFEMIIHRADIRPGGECFYSMSNGAGLKFYGKIEYLEMERPGRLVYLQSFCDENGGMSRHPLAPVWPEKMLAVVLLSEEGPGETRVTVVWEPAGNVSSEELAFFVQARGGMTEGWTGSFDKLEALIEEKAA